MRKHLWIAFGSIGIGVLALTLGITLFFVDAQLEDNQKQLIRSQIDQCVAYIQVKPNITAAEFTGTFGGLLKMRVTVFDGMSNKVLSDTSGIMYEQTNANSSDYKELTDAKNSNVAVLIRRDGASGVTYNAAAVVTPREGENWIIRLQTPKKPVLLFFSDPVPLALIMAALGVAAVIAGGIVSRRLMAPVTQIATAVTQIQHTLPEESANHHIVVYGNDEIAALATGYNAMVDYISDMSLQLSQTSVEMKSILNAMTNGLLAVDTDFRVILINQCAMQLLGIHMEPDEALGRHFMDISLNVRIEGFLKSAMEQESAELIQCETVLSPPEAERTIRMQISHLKYGSRIGGVVAMLDDVTQLRKLEKVRADFATNVSHEIKTPLTSIKGFIETLQSGAINDEQMSLKFLNIISLEADRLSRLIDDILNISRLESGDLDMVKEPICLNEQINSVIEVMRPHAEDKEIRILFEEQIEDVYVLGNADNVHQLLINLLDNGIKYSPPQKSIRVMLSYMAPNVLLRVVDNGFGIEKEHLDRLFERFYRVDKGRSRDKGGTGLGLAIVKHIVTSMNGHIQVASEVNIGTVFTVEFLARDRHGNPLAAKIEPFSA